MDRRILLSILLVIFILNFISAGTSDLTTTSTTIDYKGHTIIPTLNPTTTLDDKIYSLVIDKNSFYIKPIDNKTKLSLTNYYIKTDFNPDEIFDCKTTYSNQFGSGSICSKFDDSKFLSKNNIKSREVMVIDEKGIFWTIENWFKEIFGIKPTPAYTYIINYTGTINDTDPSFFETTSLSTIGFFNATSVTGNGLVLDSNYYGYFNTSNYFDTIVALLPYTNWTFAVWVYPQGNAIQSPYIYNGQNIIGGSAGNFGLQRINWTADNNGDKIWIHWMNSSTHIGIGVNYTNNAWNFITFKRNDKNFSIKNWNTGDLINTNGNETWGDGNGNANNLQIGYGFGAKWNGSLDNLMFWGRRALSDAELSELYNNGDVKDFSPTYNFTSSHLLISWNLTEMWNFNQDLATNLVGSLNLYNGTGSGINQNSWFVRKILNYTGDYKSFVFYNSTRSVWNITFSIINSSGTNVTLQYRTGTSYNISDPSLKGFWGLNGNTNDELGLNNGTIIGTITNSTNATVYQSMFFDGSSYINIGTNTFMNGATSATYSIWIYPTSWTQYDGILASYGTVDSPIFAYQATDGNIGYYVSSSTGLTVCLVPYTKNKWQHLTLTWISGGNGQCYMDGKWVANTSLAKAGTIAQDDVYRLGWYDYNVDWKYIGNIDEVRIYNRSLSESEVQNLYNLGMTHILWNNNGNYTTESLVNNGIGQVTTGSSGVGRFMQYKLNLNSNSSQSSPYVTSYNISFVGNQYPQVVFNTQVPLPLNISNVVGSAGVNFTYNLSDSDDGLDLTTADFFYKVNDTDDNNMYYQNGTGYIGYFQQNSPTNVSNIFTWNLLDNSYLSGTYNVGAMSEDNLPHFRLQLTNNNQYLSIQYLNISKIRQQGFFELMANRSAGTGGLRAYYCNSTWDTNSNVNTNPNCLQFYTLMNNTYAHCHLNQSCHMIFPFTNFSIVSQTGYFIVRGNTGSTWDIWYSNGNVRADYVKTSNNGITYTSNNTINPDGHLHQFNTNTTLFSYACVNDTLGLQNCSNVRIQAIGGANIAPTGLSVLNPQNLTYEKGSMVINYTPCFSPSNLAINYYNITLANTDGTYNKTIIENNTLNLNYTWNTMSTTGGSYKVEVKCYDISDTSSIARSEVFTLTNDATPPSVSLSLYNLPAFNWADFNWTITDTNIGSAINLTIWVNNILFRIANSPTSPYLMNGLHDSTNYTAKIWVNDTYGNINYTTLNFTTKYAYNDTRFDYNETSPIYVPQTCPSDNSTGYWTQNGLLTNGTISCAFIIGNRTISSGANIKQKICINKPTSQYDDCSIYGTCKYCYYV